MFICTGNSCRSQMAEGFARQYGGDRVEAFSCGVMASYVHSGTIETMADIGIDISKHLSKQIDPELLKAMDVIVTLCDNAKEHCPVVPHSCQVFHWSIEDPLYTYGTPHQYKVFGRVRDDIGERVRRLLRELQVT